METRAQKDAKTLRIAQSLAMFALLFVLAAVAMSLATLLGVEARDSWVRVALAVAVLLSAMFLVRHRRD